MRAYGLRLPVVFGTMAAMLAILFGFQFLYARQALAVPMDTSLRHVAGVLDVHEVPESSGALLVDVRLGLVPDLRSTYTQVLDAAQSASAGRHVDVKIQDDRTPTLTADYYKLNVILAQGRATGQFVEMQTLFNQESQKLGLQRADVTLGNDAMFVTLVGGGHYLYQIMPLTLTGSVSGAAAA